MVSPETIEAPLPAQGEAARLLDQASEHGSADAFAGKRRWVRYSYSLSMTLTTDPANPSASWSAALHNISGGGFGVWTRKKIDAGTAIFMREAASGPASNWIPAHVTQCIAGLRGFLVGAAFDRPGPVNATFGPAAAPAAETPVAETPCTEPAPRSVRSAPQRSLRTQCAGALGFAAYGGVVAGVVACKLTWPLDRPTWLLVALAVLAAGAALGWVAAGPTATFLTGLQDMLRRVAAGEPSGEPLGAAPAAEPHALHESICDLSLRVARRGIDERVRREKLEEINQIKSNILAIVSHDLRTPLTSILLYSQMLSEELGELPVEEQRRFLDIITQECTRLSRLVDDLLDLQRLEAGQVKWDVRPQDLSETVRSAARVFEAMAASKSIDFRVECPAALPPVEADAGKVAQVINNLLSNAMKYTPSGGAVRLWATANGSELLLGVADNGPGIPRDKWEQIFERFAQLSRPDVREISGVGLGLYIVRQIVERLGGSVWVDSEVGRGSEFYVSLPITGAQTAAARTAGLAGNTPPAGRVIVADADPALAAQIAQILRREGFEVRLAHSGCRLLSLLTQGECDVVVADVLLPDISTDELLDALQRVPNGSFRLIVHSFVGDGRELGRRGVHAFLRRPASHEGLVRAVHAAMQRHGPATRTTVLVESDEIDVKRLERLLADAGHVVLPAPTIGAASDLIRQSPPDAVVLCGDALARDAAGLRHLGIRAGEGVRVMLLCRRIRGVHRQLAQIQGVSVLTYTRGDEEAVVRAIGDVQPFSGRAPVELGS